VNIFKAFAQIGSLVDNTSGVVAPIGELADITKTIVLEKTWWSHSDFSNETLVGLSYKVDDVVTPMTSAIAYQCLTAINWIYTQAKLGKFDQTKDSLQQAFITQFGSTFDFIDSGDMVAFGNYYAPEYIIIAPYQQSGTTNWRIWFSDESLYNQYDESVIVPVTPLVALDTFFGDYDTVLALVQAIKQSDLFTRIATAKGIFPETVLRTDTFAWTDATDKTKTIDTDWISVIYGQSGNNLDSVKEEFRTYILANSTHTRDQWAVIFPDLFTSTEFIFTPMWGDYAIPKSDRATGIFSGIISFTKAMTLAHATCQGVGYTNTFIDSVIQALPSQYRSLMCAVVGGPENRNGLDTFNARYPDYINSPSTGLDFQRMSEETKGFCMMLAEMLLYGEDLTLDSGVPAGYNRLIRNGVVYIAKSYEDYLYLVTTKYSVDAAQAVIDAAATAAALAATTAASSTTSTTASSTTTGT
jgi:hypothetical protein